MWILVLFSSPRNNPYMRLFPSQSPPMEWFIAFFFPWIGLGVDKSKLSPPYYRTRVRAMLLSHFSSSIDGYRLTFVSVPLGYTTW